MITKYFLHKKRKLTFAAVETMPYIGGKKVLVCPLNWGLGHATRCIPIIERLITNGNEVIIAADGLPLTLLKERFPDLKTIKSPSYAVRYSAGKSQILVLLLQLPRILKGIWKENRWLNQLLQKENVDLVISDNRFGLWTKHCRCVYITHQIMIKMPRPLKWAERLAYRLHKAIIDRYDECWIPDNAENGLSGDLAHRYPLPDNARFIGLLSRFGDKTFAPDSSYETVALISGPEPQRSLLEQTIIREFSDKNERLLLVRGLPGNSELPETSVNIDPKAHLEDSQLAPFLLGCQRIICRSGYSSIMDLQALNCLHKATLIPTPGQTEQEYLAELHGIR